MSIFKCKKTVYNILIQNFLLKLKHYYIISSGYKLKSVMKLEKKLKIQLKWNLLE